jgi:parallel beta-helix repeat protein
MSVKQLNTPSTLESMEPRRMFATFVVTTVADTGAGSLRDALSQANRTSDTDVIQFNIGTGAKTIQPLSQLPFIKYPVIINASTQPGFTDRPLIELRGDRAGTNAYGLNIGAGNSVVRGLVINRFEQAGILITGKGNNVIAGNYVGTDASGATAAPNKKGIIVQSAGNRIGGRGIWARNVISGNQGTGVQFYTAAATGNSLQGSYVGLNASGTAAIPNIGVGVGITGGVNNLIGGKSGKFRNVISGNTTDGIIINTPGATGNKIAANYIGTNAAGNAAVANGNYGIEISEMNNIVGGKKRSSANLISGNAWSGVVLWLKSGSFNTVINNYIGTDITGTTRLGNGVNGIDVSNGSSDNIITRNTISGNYKSGIMMYQGDNNIITRNTIGLTADRKAALGNMLDGIRLQQTKEISITRNTIGYNGPKKPDSVAYTDSGFAVFNGDYNTFSVVKKNAKISDTLFNLSKI